MQTQELTNGASKVVGAVERLYAKTNRPVKRRELGKVLGVSDTSVQNYLADARKAGAIKTTMGRWGGALPATAATGKKPKRAKAKRSAKVRTARIPTPPSSGDSVLSVLRARLAGAEMAAARYRKAIAALEGR